MKPLVVFAFGSIALAASGSIRDVDFKNFIYPFTAHYFISVPNKLNWMPTTENDVITLRNGQHRFPCEADESLCPLLTLDVVTFGNINGLPGTSALVVTTYHTGGTALAVPLRAHPPQGKAAGRRAA